MTCGRISVLLVLGVLLAVGIELDAGEQKGPARPKYVRKPNDFAVICTLFNGPPKEGKVTLPNLPITYDANFVIGARVEGIEFGKSPWPAGTLLNFLIHSPTLTFGNRFDGERFVLTFSPFRPKTASDKIWFAPETEYLLRDIERVPGRTTEDPAKVPNQP